MEPLKLSIAIPFRKDGSPEAHPGCINAFDSNIIHRYISALNAEIAVAAQETGDLEVHEIEFINGSFTHLGNEDISKIIAKIRENFKVSANVRIIVSATASFFDFLKLSAVKGLGDVAIVFDVPTTDENGLKKAGFISSRESVLEALDTCSQNSFSKFICVVDPAQNYNSDVFRQTVIDLLLRKPYGICFISPPDDEFINAVSPVFENYGYIQHDTGWFSDNSPFFSKFNIQIGCGPYTVSMFDDNAIRSTQDFDFYCEHSTDYQALVTHA